MHDAGLIPLCFDAFVPPWVISCEVLVKQAMTITVLCNALC